MMGVLESMIRPSIETKTNQRQNSSQNCLKLISAISRVFFYCVTVVAHARFWRVTIPLKYIATHIAPNIF